MPFFFCFFSFLPIVLVALRTVHALVSFSARCFSTPSSSCVPHPSRRVWGRSMLIYETPGASSGSVGPRVEVTAVIYGSACVTGHLSPLDSTRIKRGLFLCTVAPLSLPCPRGIMIHPSALCAWTRCGTIVVFVHRVPEGVSWCLLGQGRDSRTEAQTSRPSLSLVESSELR